MFHNGMLGGGMWFGWLFWIVLAGVVIYFISKISNKNNSETLTDEPPLTILKRRYANGEIDKEEYQKIRNDLSQNL